MHKIIIGNFMYIFVYLIYSQMIFNVYYKKKVPFFYSASAYV